MGLFDRAKAEALNESMDTRDGLDIMKGLAEQAHASERPGSFYSDTPEATTEDVPATDDIEAAEYEPDRPEWLPSNFRTPEALAESYKEAQAALTQAQQHRAELLDYVEELAAHVEAQAQFQQPDFEPAPQPTSSSRAARLAAIAQRVEQVQAQFAPQITPESPQWDEAVANNLARLMPEWDEALSEKVQALLAERELPEDALASPQAMAYRLAQLATVIKGREAQAEQQRAEMMQRAFKSQSQTLSGQAGRPAPKSSWDDTWAEIQDASRGTFSEIVHGK